MWLLFSLGVLLRLVGSCSCFGMSLVRGRATPAHGSVRILRDTCSVLVHEGQIELALNIALSSRLAEPGGPCWVVLRNPLALPEHSAEIVLGLGMSLLRRLSIPSRGSAVVLRDTNPILVHDP